MKKLAIKVITFVFCTVLFMPINSVYATGDLDNRIVILDPGHSAGYNNYEGYTEGDAMFELALKIKPLLEERGATVYLTRENGDSVDLVTRTSYANKIALEVLLEAYQQKLELATKSEIIDIQNKIDEINSLLPMLNNLCLDSKTYGPIYTNSPFDRTKQRKVHPDMKRVFELQNDPEIAGRVLMISLHSNAVSNPSKSKANGVDCFIITNTLNYFNNYSHTEENSLFGNKILDNLSTLGFKRNSVSNVDYHIIREVNIPTALVENGFHTNESDRYKLQNSLNEMANVYVDTITEYFNSDLILDSYNSDAITISIDDKILETNAKNQISHNKVWIPVSTIFDLLSSEINWNDETIRTTISLDGVIIDVNINKMPTTKE